MDEKLRFVFEYERDEQSMKELCARFGIAGRPGYVWLRRYRQYGLEGLVELNRAPRHHPNQTAAGIEPSGAGASPGAHDVGTTQAEADSGAGAAGSAWPATSTMGEIVKRAGLVVQRRKRRRTEPYTEPLAHAVESNRVWCADFKGWFARRRNAHRSADDQRCLQPLSAALPGGGEDRHGAGAGHLRGGVPRVWAALGDAHR